MGNVDILSNVNDGNSEELTIRSQGYSVIGLDHVPLPHHKGLFTLSMRPGDLRCGDAVRLLRTRQAQAVTGRSAEDTGLLVREHLQD